MSPMLEGIQDVLAGRIPTTQEPDIRDSQRANCLPSFYLANLAHCQRILRANIAIPCVAASSVNHCHPLVLFIYLASKIGSHHGLVVRVRNDNEDVRLEPRIRGPVIDTVSVPRRIFQGLRGNALQIRLGQNGHAENNAGCLDERYASHRLFSPQCCTQVHVCSRVTATIPLQMLTLPYLLSRWAVCSRVISRSPAILSELAADYKPPRSFSNSRLRFRTELSGLKPRIEN